jgi:hypothetical protein
MNASLCHVCGIQADHVCNQCYGAAYCGAECQARDWREGGHERECYDATSTDPVHLANEIFCDLECPLRTELLGDEILEEGEAIAADLDEHVASIGAGIGLDEDHPAIEAAHEWLQENRICGSIAPELPHLLDHELIELAAEMGLEDHRSVTMAQEQLNIGEELSERDRSRLFRAIVKTDFDERVEAVGQEYDQVDGVIHDLLERTKSKKKQEMTATSKVARGKEAATTLAGRGWWERKGKKRDESAILSGARAQVRLDQLTKRKQKAAARKSKREQTIAGGGKKGPLDLRGTRPYEWFKGKQRNMEGKRRLSDIRWGKGATTMPAPQAPNQF